MATLRDVLHQVELLVIFIGWLPSVAVHLAKRDMLHPLTRRRLLLCLERVPFFTVPRSLSFKDAVGAMWQQVIGRLQQAATVPGFVGTREVVVRYRSPQPWHNTRGEPLALGQLDRELWRIGFQDVRDIFTTHGTQFETHHQLVTLYSRFACPMWLEMRSVDCVLAEGFEVSVRARFQGRAMPLRP